MVPHPLQRLRVVAAAGQHVVSAPSVEVRSSGPVSLWKPGSLDDAQTATVLDFLEQVTAAMRRYAAAADDTSARPEQTDDS